MFLRTHFRKIHETRNDKEQYMRKNHNTKPMFYKSNTISYVLQKHYNKSQE